MIRSGAAFNPMRRTPPPPPYMDTFNLDPTEYIRVLSAEGHTFVVHRDCACSSPLLRKCLANRLDPALPTVRISWGDEVSTRKDSESTGESREAGGEEATTPKSVGNVGEQRGGDLRPPVIHFPELPAVWLEVVLQYLHHKHRYEGDTGDRPPFHVPVEGAIEVMKVAEGMSRRQRAAVQPEQTIAPQIVFDKSHMVCVRSADGQFFLLDRNCAMVSGVLRRFLQRKGCEEEPCTVVTATATIATTTSTTTNTTTPAAAAAVTLPVLPSLSSPPPESCDLTRIGTETYETIILEEIRSDLLELAIQAMYFKYRYDGEPEKRPLEVHHSAEMRHRLAAVSVLLDM